MIDLNHLTQYRENNRIEAKRALGGLPLSIWETYSAFANTLGGILLLGVEENSDKSLRAVNLPDPERLVREFWELVNDPQRTSANILSDSDVRIEEVEGDRIIVVTVPRAQRLDRPVYIGSDPFTGTYRRNGEGDYRCSRSDVESMLRDAAVQTPDMALLPHLSLDVLDPDTLFRYRTHMRRRRPGHAWESLPDAAFLCQIHAAGTDAETSTLHPTAAGLLMFGRAEEIAREFPGCRLEYEDADVRICSEADARCGNIYDFYLRARGRLEQRLPVAPQSEGDVRRALHEALVNCLVNADYRSGHAVRIVREAEQVRFTNPGAFRMEVEAAKDGGHSDPRNAALIQMFSLAALAGQSGSGLPFIYSVWRRQGWAMPVIREAFEPECITLTMPFTKPGWRRTARIPMQAGWIVDHLTDCASATLAEIASYTGLSRIQTKSCLSMLLDQGILVAEGDGLRKRYRLKA